MVIDGIQDFVILSHVWKDQCKCLALPTVNNVIHLKHIISYLRNDPSQKLIML